MTVRELIQRLLNSGIPQGADVFFVDTEDIAYSVDRVETMNADTVLLRTQDTDNPVWDGMGKAN